MPEDEGGVNRSLWRRINLLDVLFIISILVIALAAASFFTPFSIFGIGGEQRIISYTVEIKNVDGAMADNIKAGDTAFDAAGKNAIGKVTAVSRTDAVRYVYNEVSGQIERAPVPKNADGNTPVNITVTIQVTADFSRGGGYNVGGNRISVGTPVQLCFTGFTGTGNCVSIYLLSQAD